jgi:hypothetical protein
MEFSGKKSYKWSIFARLTFACFIMDAHSTDILTIAALHV